MPQNHTLRLAVDIGGTFTDTVLSDQNGHVIATNKTLTTPHNPADAAIEGVHRVLRDAGASMQSVTGFVHGTTLATNALIERRGATVACITTEGFRDILEIAYERRYSQYDINIEKPDLIVPRERCFTVPERLSFRGEVISPLNSQSIPQIIAQLDACQADAVAICLLHAYANPAHEQQLKQALQQQRPQLALSLSSDISPEAREFERLCTTVANAYIQPLMAGYLQDFTDQFNAAGLRCPILMMTAGGGMTTLQTAARHPIRLVESGPAGGAMLAATIATRIDASSILSFDMGGTTAKLCLIDNGVPQTARHFEIARARRFIKGSGMPVRIPVIDMIEIGAGGGSIASVDQLGRLQVGPRSAGSDPGPAAFGLGGNEATVTDADVALGLIEPARFAEGRLAIDPTAAATAMDHSVSAALDISTLQAASGVSEIVDESMASAARMHAVESGKDLGTRTMLAFGGNGPLHATRVARRAGVSRILIPPNPGVGSAVGFLSAPVSFEVVRSHYARLQQLDVVAVNSLYRQMFDSAAQIVRDGAPNTPMQQHRHAFMRYHGQGHEIEIRLPERDLKADDCAALQLAFEQAYQHQFSRAVPGMSIEILNWSLRLVSAAQNNPPAATGTPASQTPVPHAQRRFYCEVSDTLVSAPLFQRQDLTPGDNIPGPALILEAQTTTLVSADFTATVDNGLNLVLERRDSCETTP